MKTLTKIMIGSAIVLSVAGGAAWAKGGYCDQRGPQGLAQGLELTAEQQVKFNALVQQMQARRQQMREQRQARRGEMLQLLDAATLDQQKARELVNQRTAAMQQNAEAMIEAIAGFTDSLTAEQKAQLRQNIETRMQRMQHRMQQRGRHGPPEGRFGY